MTAPTDQRRAFDAAIESYKAGDTRQALAGFVAITAAQPTMSDAWLGRVACGDQAIDVLEAAHRNSRSLYRETRRIGLVDGDLHARLDAPLYVTMPVWSRSTIALAYATALITDRRYAEAADVLENDQAGAHDNGSCAGARASRVAGEPARHHRSRPSPSCCCTRQQSSAAGNAVLLPAPSGSGKSTLAAGLVAAGFGYLTDDVCAIDLETGRVRPYPKPITLATEVVRQFERGGHPLLDDEERALMHTDAYIRARHLGGHVGRESTARTIVVPTYTAGGRTELTAMSRAEAVIVLGEQSFNFNELAPDALRLAADLVRGCDCYRLTYSDLDAAVALIAGGDADVSGVRSRLVKAAS